MWREVYIHINFTQRLQKLIYLHLHILTLETYHSFKADYTPPFGKITLCGI